jgi:hypothetical protein
LLANVPPLVIVYTSSVRSAHHTAKPLRARQFLLCEPGRRGDATPAQRLDAIKASRHAIDAHFSLKQGA